MVILIIKSAPLRHRLIDVNVCHYEVAGISRCGLVGVCVTLGVGSGVSNAQARSSVSSDPDTELLPLQHHVCLHATVLPA